MKRLWVVAAFALPVVAQHKPFSHRLHLKLKPDCVSCHARALSSTRVDDNLLPSSDRCLPCHRTVAIGKPRKTLLAKFSHREHFKLGNIAPLLAAAIDAKSYLSPPGDIRRHLNTKNLCEGCHRGLEESDTASRMHHPQMADCLVCHSKIEPPYSCEMCHAPAVNLKPPNHTPDFLDRHTRASAKLDKQSCAVCHGRRFTCLGCH